MVGMSKYTSSPASQYADAGSFNSNMNHTTTLHLPRILCLHGGGTNASIFRLQCRVLEKHLRHSFRLVYAEAPFPTLNPGPDVTSVFADQGPFKTWLLDHRASASWASADVSGAIDTALTLAMAADDANGGMGQWVGLLGFSQGAKIAASVLYRQQTLPWDTTSFRFAALFAGRGPLVWLAPDMPRPRGLVDAATPFDIQPELADILSGTSEEHILSLPTIHVHGLRDPGLDRHRELLEEYCDPLQSALIEWDGGHRIPIKRRDVEMVVRQIERISREAAVAAVAPPAASFGDAVFGLDEYLVPAEKGFSLQEIGLYTEHVYRIS
ncbi:serine hydrolase-domain-containing protein [Aspergillus crustosus]